MCFFCAETTSVRLRTVRSVFSVSYFSVSIMELYAHDISSICSSIRDGSVCDFLIAAC